MSVKTFVASDSKVLSKFINDACKLNGMETYFMQHESALIEEMQAIQPELIFLQASIIDRPGENLITKIKSDELLGGAYIVVYASRPEGAEFAYKVGGDAFLPIPFRNEQFEQILRSILNQPKEILVVSKRNELFKAMEQARESFDFVVSWAKSAEEAVKVSSEQFPDLIICDYDLPQRSGAAFSALVKHSHLLGHIPVIVMATSNDPVLIEECFEAGANEVFVYPFDRTKHIPVISAIVKPPKKGKRMIALVVDDSVTVRNLISKMFKQLGYVVLTAANGQEALELMEQQKPDIITSDYDMPVMDGWQFCSRLRQHSDYAAIPVIMVSSRSTITDKRKARALGVAAYLTKPFTTEDLERIVKATMAQSQNRRRSERLEKYAAADAAKAISAVIEGIKSDPVPEERFVTVMSCGIVDFTSKFGWGDAEKIAMMLNEYFSGIMEILVDKGGTIDSIMGDEVLVRFDSSGDRQNDALNAVDAAVSMFEWLERYNEDSSEMLKIRVGIHSDGVVIANFGSIKHRLVYSMIGEGISIAKALQHQAGANGCLLSGDTYALVEESLGELPRFTVSYKATSGITAYKL